MKSVKWGLIGCGDIAMRCVGPAINALSDSELVAVCRKDPTMLEACAERLNAGNTYSDWQDLAQDDDIDAVYIATPVFLHCEQAVAAAEAGKHVLCEKPMALSSAECEKMIAAARQSGVYLGIAYYRHYYPVVARLKELITSGFIGQVMLIQIDAYETPLFGPDHPRHWIFQKDKAGGGCMMDFGCHRIEVMLNLLGDTIEVNGLTSTFYPGHDVEDAAAALLKFENGACGVLTVMRGGTENRDIVYIRGTKGAIYVDTLNAGNLIAIAESGTQKEVVTKEENAHIPLIEAFNRSIIAGKPPEVDGQMGLKVQKLIEAIYP